MIRRNAAARKPRVPPAGPPVVLIPAGSTPPVVTFQFIITSGTPTGCVELLTSIPMVWNKTFPPWRLNTVPAGTITSITPGSTNNSWIVCFTRPVFGGVGIETGTGTTSFTGPNGATLGGGRVIVEDAR